MSAVQTAGQAVARVAYLSSDVVLSVQPSLQRDSEFSSHLRQLAESGIATLTASGKPAQIEALRQNNDPFLSAYKPLRNGEKVAVTTSSTTLLPAIPHLYKLANYPVVIHVAVHPRNNPDYSEITSIRQCGFAFLNSETLQEAQDIAITAHSLAARSGRGVIHFFDPSNSKKDNAIATEDAELLRSLLEPAKNLVTRRSAATNSLYVSDGSQALITEAARQSTDPAAGQSDAPSSTENAKIPPTASSQSASSQSSQRDSSADSRPSVSSNATSVEPVHSRPVQSDDILKLVEEIWAQFNASTSRAYTAFEYTGPTNAENALFLFGSTGIFVDELEAAGPSAIFAKLGVITARLYRPWAGNSLAAVIPPSVKRIAVLEQIRRRTTKWGPVLLDVLTSLRPDPSNGVPRGHAIIGHQLGYLESSTAGQALQGIWLNLNSKTPIQNLEVGSSKALTPAPEQALEVPQVESAYNKILDQVFADRLYIANRLQASTVGISRGTAASPEYGFGSLLARIQHRKRFIQEVADAARSKEFITAAPANWLAKWSLAADDSQKASELAPEVIARLGTDGSRLSSELLSSRGLFYKESNWLIGSDAWAYDLGNSGVHHVLESGANVNMLIIDSQPYSERAAMDATRRKKDIGLYAMNYGNAYVASVAVYGQYTQVLEAMIEADKFDGPSVIVAYLPYNKENDSPLTVLQETKKAIDLGYWPLYRWNPRNEEKDLPNFTLDSSRIRRELEEFLRRDNHLSQLMKRQPELSANLSGSYGSEVRALQKRNAKDAYEQMLEGLYGAPMTVLFASDNSNAANLAKRLGSRGKARGLKTIVMEMDEYPIEDLSKEENIILITSTAGQGEFPQNGRAFWDEVKNGDFDLKDIKFSVFALGDSHYWPRKEDKIYYNKPGKDLDARIAFLGAERLAEVGLGDDQDPDGYQTGYKEWEPKLWQALGVDKVEGLPEEPPPITNEDIKRESNYLRGTIAEGLKDESTGAIAAADQQLTKFHGTYMQDDRDVRDERKAAGLEPAYSFMIRCRLNGGVATPDQWLRMSAIADELGNSTMKLTTRQTFQFHGVVKKKLKPAMQAINRAMMTTLAACGDVNRNLMVSTATTTSKYHKDVHAVSAKISDHLLPATQAYHEIWLTDDNGKKTQVAGNAVVDQDPGEEQEPLYGKLYLPRKFKITLAIPPHNDTDVYAHDIGLIAIKGDNGRLVGFNFLAGGGMGVTHNNKKTYPRTGSMLGYAPADQAHIVCEKIMLVQRDNGDRTNRKHARLKYTIDDMGVDVFRAEVEKLLGYKFEDQKPFTFESNVDTFGWQKDEEGLNHFTCFIENGRVEDTPEFPMKTGLVEIAKVHKGEFRLSPNQHLVVSNIHDDDKVQIQNLLKKYKLDNLQFSALRLSSSACVAFPTCGLAMAESERYLPVLITKLEDCLEENGLRHDSIVMRMTGCPNGCARPWLAEIAFVGKAFGAYNMYLGGGYHGQRVNKLYRSSIQEEEILEIVKPMFARYAKERNEGEHFGDWTIRAGIIKETKVGKEFHNDVAEEEEDEE